MNTFKCLVAFVGAAVFAGFAGVSASPRQVPPTLPGVTVFTDARLISADGARFTTEWVQYKIDLTGWSVASVIGAFGFATNDTDNPGYPQSIYFDDIVWE